MKRLKASEYPELRRFFAGYLHEDFVAEHGTAAGGLRAFVADANASERKRLGDEARRFLELTHDVPFEEVLALVEQLGSRWMPQSRDELRKVLERVEHKS